MNDDQRPHMDDAPAASSYGRGSGSSDSTAYGGSQNADYQAFPHAPAPYGSYQGGTNFSGSGGSFANPSDSDRSLAAIAHVATLIGTLISAGWLGFLVPLIMWFIYKDRSAFVRQAAAGAFNFNISMWIGNAVAWIFAVTLIGIPIAIIIWIVVGILWIVCHILGTIRALRGDTFRYPLQLPILR